MDYLIQAIRAASRMPGYTVLSMIGLVLSLSGTIILTRFLHQEWTIDSWMPHLDRTFATGVVYEQSPEKHPILWTAYDQVHEKGFSNPLPGNSMVEAFTTVHLRRQVPVEPEFGNTFFPPCISTDSAFARVFPLRTVEGTLEMKTEGQAIVSQEMARRLFPDESAVGQTLSIDGQPHTVVGIFRQPPTKSSLRFDVANYYAQEGYFRYGYSFTLALLRQGADVGDFNRSQPVLTPQSFPSPIRLCLFPYDGALSVRMAEFPAVCLPIQQSHLWLFLATAVLLFGVGLFNFLNLYAVMRSTRVHEMQMRRIFGATRRQLFLQLYAETLLISAASMLGVWMVIEIPTPFLPAWFDIEVLTMPLFDTVLSLSIMFLLPLLVAVRPIPNHALVVRAGGTNPIRKLRHYASSLQGWAGGGSSISGGGSSGPGSGSSLFLFLQYFVSISLISLSLFMMLQLHRAVHADPGYRTEGVLSCVPSPEVRLQLDQSHPERYQHFWSALDQKEKLLRQKLADCPYIQDMCMEPDMHHFFNNTADGLSLQQISVNEHLMNILDLRLLEGRALCDSLAGPLSYNCLLNQTALRQLGIKDWRTEKLQFRNRIWYDQEFTDDTHNPPFRIVGILSDFNTEHLTVPQRPMFFVYRRDQLENPSRLLSGENVLLRVEPGAERKVMRFLLNVEKEVFGADELRHEWLAERRSNLYQDDRRTMRIFSAFSLLSISVTCLGVLGLMMFQVRRRYREIALRKVHGARFRHILLLLSGRYLSVFLVAAVVSAAVTLSFLQNVITRFYSIPGRIAWWIPLLSALLVLLLSALTLMVQIWRASRIEPTVVINQGGR